jgi:NAD(P)H-nitrite reductase large subunit
MTAQRERVVVVGAGMVGHRFVEELVAATWLRGR